MEKEIDPVEVDIILDDKGHKTNNDAVMGRNIGGAVNEL